MIVNELYAMGFTSSKCTAMIATQIQRISAWIGSKVNSQEVARSVMIAGRLRRDVFVVFEFR